MRKNKITVINGDAKLEKGADAPTVCVDDGQSVNQYNAKHVILATGARARELPAIGLTADEQAVLSYRGAMVQKTVPESLLVIGSGAIGIEFASFYKEAGSEVTVVEQLDQILPAEDEEISTLARTAFEKSGIEFGIDRCAGCLFVSAKTDKNGVTLDIKLSDGTTVQKQAERVLLAVGIVANSDGLGLEDLGVQIAKTPMSSLISSGQTNIPGCLTPLAT